MKIELIPIKDLVLLENNPRKITKDQMHKLCHSIKEDPEFLNCRPVLVNMCDARMYVYAGNQRVRAAKKLKMKEIPCVIDHDLPSHIQDSRCIKDNKTYGEFDFNILANEWDIDVLLSSGFKPEELIGSDINDMDTDRKKEEKGVCDKCGSKIKKSS
jgi:ParB-like chromosome segregation protein Spo0J